LINENRPCRLRGNGDGKSRSQILGPRIRNSWGGYTEDHARRVELCFLSDPSGTKIELVAPLGENGKSDNKNSPVSAWLEKNGPSPYHIAYASGDVPADAANLRKKGFLLVEPPSPALAFGGRPVAFLYGKTVGLIELVPENQEPGSE
jgi:methylmalonyl-CoA/ethylmalonyl-CoA epimerase